jgi:hypothetical protein
MCKTRIERLRELVTPPAAPVCKQRDWRAVESELGTALPTDYKEFIGLFGQGGFVGEKYCSGIQITSYLTERPDELARGYSAYFSTIDDLPYSVYPRKPGLLGFANYGDKDTIGWNTKGSPDEWDIVYHDPESGFHVVEQTPMLEFLISVLEETSPLHKQGVIRMGNMKGPHSFIPEP